MRKGKRAIGALVAVISLSAANVALSDDKLDENKIGEILTTSFTDLKNVTKYACVNLFDLGPKLPGNLETASLTYRNQKGVIRKEIAALINSGLITVRLDSGKGPVTTVGSKGKETRQDVPLSYADLTPLGMSFYRYDDAEFINMPKDTYRENRFCTHIQYGGIERFMKPAKNPFDKNPHLVTWVEFLWRPDESKTPWLAVPELKERLSYYFYPRKDDWMRQGIMLEQNDDGRWELGNKPYTIRW